MAVPKSRVHRTAQKSDRSIGSYPVMVRGEFDDDQTVLKLVFTQGEVWRSQPGTTTKHRHGGRPASPIQLDETAFHRSHNRKRVRFEATPECRGTLKNPSARNPRRDWVVTGPDARLSSIESQQIHWSGLLQYRYGPETVTYLRPQYESLFRVSTIAAWVLRVSRIINSVQNCYITST
jgi:hypothetical protein